MDIEFKKINVNRDFDQCVSFRKDSHICSFGSDSNFIESIIGYQEKIYSRLEQEEWFYIHLWQQNKIVGQLEFKTFSSERNIGYIHLFYLVQSLRGSGVSNDIHRYIIEKLSDHGCEGAILSVSRINLRALAFYKRLGWEYLAPNPKHDLTDFYRLPFKKTTALE